MRSARKVSSVMTTRLSGLARGAQTAATAAAAMRAAAQCARPIPPCAIGQTTRYGPGVVPEESEGPGLRSRVGLAPLWPPGFRTRCHLTVSGDGAQLTPTRYVQACSRHAAHAK